MLSVWDHSASDNAAGSCFDMFGLPAAAAAQKEANVL